LLPICAPQLLDAARDDYAHAVAAPALERLEDAEILLHSAKETARRAGYEAEKLVKAEKDILPPPDGERPAPPVAHLSDAEKARLIGEVGGHEAYAEVLAGTRELPPAYWPEADREAFTVKHGAQAWEGFLAGTWSPPDAN